MHIFIQVPVPQTGQLCCCRLRSFVEFNAAYEQCKGRFDVIINCVAVRINFQGVLGMLAPDGVAVQVRALSCCACIGPANMHCVVHHVLMLPRPRWACWHQTAWPCR